MARSPSSPIILPCPAKRVSAFSVVDGSVYRPPYQVRPFARPGHRQLGPFGTNGPYTFCLHPAKIAKGCGFFLLNPSAVFTQATSSHAESDRLDLCGSLRPASSRNPIPVDSRRFPPTRHWGGSARRGRASGAACVRGRVREETNRQESTGIDRSRVCPCGAKRTRATAQGRERVDSGAARREGPRA